MQYEPIDVECYSGYKANERPLAFTFREIRRGVRDILDRWYGGSLDSSCPEISYFKIRTTEGQIAIIRYQSLFDAWSIRV